MQILAVLAVALLVGCGGTPAPAAGPSAPAGASAAAPTTSRVTDGTGACPFTSEMDPAHGRVFPGCHLFAPMEAEIPFVACTDDAPCLRPCRRVDMDSDGTVQWTSDFRYDDAGRLVDASMQDASGNPAWTTRYGYPSPTMWTVDQWNLAGITQTTITLDDGGRVVERRSRYASTLGDRSTVTSRFQRDEAGRLTREDRTVEKHGRTSMIAIPYAYDDQGRLVARERPNVGRPESRYRYGADGKVEAIEYHGIEWRIRRDPQGRVIELRMDGAVSRRFVYDAAGRLIEVHAVAGGTARLDRRYEYACALSRR